MSRRMQENVVAVLLLGVFVFAIVLASGFSPRARVVPLPIAVIGALMMLAQLFVQNFLSAGSAKADALEFLTGRSKSEVVKPDAGDVSAEDDRTKRELIAIGFVLLMMTMVIFIGPLESVFLFSAAYMGIKRQYSWLWSIAFAAVFALGVYVLFDAVLGVQIMHTEFSLIPDL